MFGARPKPIEQTTARDIWLSLIFGTLIIGSMVVGSLFIGQPDLFIWAIRCFCVVMLFDWWRRCFLWRRALSAYQTRSKRETEVEPTKTNPLAKLPPLHK
jgi:hypothetical protein